MNRYRATVLVAALVILSCGCANKKNETEELEYGQIVTSAAAIVKEEETAYSSILPVREEREVETLPVYEIGDFTVPAERSLCRFSGSRITFWYPDTANISLVDDYNAYIFEEDGSQYYVHRFYSSNYTDTKNISKYSSDVIKALSFSFNGNTYYGRQYDSGKLQDVVDPAGEIVNEHPSLTMASFDTEKMIDTIEPHIAVSYRFMNDEAYMVVGLSMSKEASDLNDVTYDIIRSLKPFTPAAATAATEFSQPFSMTETAKLLIPSGWKKYKDGSLSIFRPDEANGFYAGTEIYIITDPAHIYSADALGLPTGIGGTYIKHIYKTSEPYHTDTDIIDFAEISQGGMNGYFYEVRNNIYPQSKQAVIALPSSGTKAYSYAYTFTDPNGIPFLIGISYTDKNRDMIYTFGKRLIDTLTTADK